MESPRGPDEQAPTWAGPIGTGSWSGPGLWGPLGPTTRELLFATDLLIQMCSCPPEVTEGNPHSSKTDAAVKGSCGAAASSPPDEPFLPRPLSSASPGSLSAHPSSVLGSLLRFPLSFCHCSALPAEKSHVLFLLFVREELSAERAFPCSV